MQEVTLDKNVKLIDSPGIVFASAGAEGEAAAALRNAVRIEQLADPLAPGEK
jgi:nuclear GTP-binding protein